MNMARAVVMKLIFRKRQKLRLAAGNWGINYSGFKIPEAKGEIVAGTEQPVFYWKDSPAVSGMAFYNSDKFPSGSKIIYWRAER